MMTLPIFGPVAGSYTVKFSAAATLPSGAHVFRGASLPGDGTVLAQVEREINDRYNQWHPFLGCRVTIDFGKGPLYRILDEAFGRLFLAEDRQP